MSLSTGLSPIVPCPEPPTKRTKALLVLSFLAGLFASSWTPCHALNEPLKHSITPNPSLHRKPVESGEKPSDRAGLRILRRNLHKRYVQAPKSERQKRRLEAYLKQTRESAERGEAEGQYRLGLSYDVGRLVPKNYEEAAKWYKKAADQGHLKAQVYLGMAYESGRGVTKDLKQAAKLYLQAAEKGSPTGQYRAGWMYERGHGVPEDRAQAVEWYKKAAAQGYKSAKRRLQRLGVTVPDHSVQKHMDKKPRAERLDRSRRQLRGDRGRTPRVALTRKRAKSETAKPLEKTDFWEKLQQYEEKAENGDLSAQYQLGRLYENASEEDQDYKQAAKWYRTAAEKGHPESRFCLGWMYEQGKGVEKDYREAFKWYSAAAEKGYSAAYTFLGLIYEVGRGVPRNLEESIKWYKKGADKGNKRAQKRLAMLDKETKPHEEKVDYKALRERLAEQARSGSAEARHKLGDLYYFGRGVERNLKEAAGMYSKAAENGFKDSQYMLGHMYENGLGVDKDLGSAIKWYKKAAKAGHTQAQTRLGTKYRRGEGVSRNYKEAVKWYTLAAQNGDPMAQAGLGLLCEVGRGLSKDATAAVKWYTKAAEKGHADVQFLLARIYETGQGVPKDEKAAVKWFKESAERGYVSARDHLRRIEETRRPEKVRTASTRRTGSRDRRTRLDRLRERSKAMAHRFERILERLEQRRGDRKTLVKWERRLMSASKYFEKADLERLMTRLNQLKIKAGKPSKKPATAGSLKDRTDQKRRETQERRSTISVGRRNPTEDRRKARWLRLPVEVLQKRIRSLEERGGAKEEIRTLKRILAEREASEKKTENSPRR